MNAIIRGKMSKRLDKIFLESTIRENERTRQFLLRMDALGKQMYDNLFDFIHENQRKNKKRKKTSEDN